jgi:hypothetical protein
VRQVHGAAAGCELGVVPPGDTLELRFEGRPDAGRQERRPVLLTFAAAHHDLVPVEVDVLDPDGEALEQAEAAAVEQLRDETERRFQVLEERVHLAAREHGRKVEGALGALEANELGEVEREDAAVEEDDGAEGLVLRGGGRVAVDGEVVQEGGDLGRAEGSGMAAAVEGDVGADPVEVRLLGAGGLVQAADRRGDGFEEGHGSAVGLGWGLWVGSPLGSSTRAPWKLRACGRFFGAHRGGAGTEVASGLRSVLMARCLQRQSRSKKGCTAAA